MEFMAMFNYEACGCTIETFCCLPMKAAGYVFGIILLISDLILSSFYIYLLAPGVPIRGKKMSKNKN